MKVKGISSLETSRFKVGVLRLGSGCMPVESVFSTSTPPLSPLSQGTGRVGEERIVRRILMEKGSNNDVLLLPPLCREAEVQEPPKRLSFQLWAGCDHRGLGYTSHMGCAMCSDQ